jgi:hypothetical protein
MNNPKNECSLTWKNNNPFYETRKSDAVQGQYRIFKERDRHFLVWHVSSCDAAGRRSERDIGAAASLVGAKTLAQADADSCQRKAIKECSAA